MRLRRFLSRSGLVVTCACGCPRTVHEHYGRGTYCGRHEGCPKWRPRLARIRLTDADLRLLAADPRRAA